MTTVESLSVPYDPTQPGNLFKQFDLYAPPSSNQRPLLCFVHGGAWRSEDKSQHADLARKLAIATGCCVTVPNYRLTGSGEDTIRHPVHAADILQYLVYAVANSAGLYDPSKLFLIGHSCSAHMLASIVLDSSHVDPSLTPPQNVLDAVQGLILSEGIYSLTQLLVRFPKYKEWFIEAAFGSNVKQYDVNTFALRSNVVSPCPWLLLQSPNDTLIDVPQTTTMHAHLQTLYHNYSELIQQDISTLNADHDAILATEEYISLVTQFVKNK